MHQNKKPFFAYTVTQVPKQLTIVFFPENNSETKKSVNVSFFVHQTSMNFNVPIISL